MTRTLWFFLLLSILFSSSLALQLQKHYAIHEDNDLRTPVPSDKVVECLTQMTSQLMQCRNQSLKNWNVHDYSPLGDVCCTQFEMLDCNLDHVTKSKCSTDEMDEVSDYFNELIAFYNENTCRPFPRGSTHCTLPIMAKVTHERPPEPSPLAIDCLSSIRPEVRLQCFESAARKWNITKKSHPVKNLCCAIWDNIDCLDVVVNVRCPKVERDATEKYFKQLENWTAVVGPCKDATYHSANCTTKAEVNDHQMLKAPKLDESYVPFVFPAKPQRLEEPPVSEVDGDYRAFLMDYILTVFPHLLNLLILLTVVLVAVIVVQCFLIGRQLKRDQVLSATQYKGYHKIDRV